MAEVKRDWAKYEADVLYQHVYNTYWKGQKIMPLKYSYVLESRNHAVHAIPTTPQKPAHMLISIKHRHLPLTICFLVQSWTGLPRVIRMNAAHFIVYMMGDKEQLKQIYENFGNTIEEEDVASNSRMDSFLNVDVELTHGLQDWD